ncbi:MULTISPECIES: hypothetical protein [unclassified Mesorhizobium]|uniref:hypothetical protein n=1 Tax=unclassified Mesorhizobium TaxID=325217 RepID=UPI001674B2B7|nr:MULTISPECIES: hypothetical protein [unclassified Mesorhizobium]
MSTRWSATSAMGFPWRVSCTPFGATILSPSLQRPPGGGDAAGTRHAAFDRSIRLGQYPSFDIDRIGGDANATLASGDLDALTAAGLTALAAQDASGKQIT